MQPTAQAVGRIAKTIQPRRGETRISLAVFLSQSAVMPYHHSHESKKPTKSGRSPYAEHSGPKPPFPPQKTMMKDASNVALGLKVDS
jgi:hypothetical protein